MPCSETRRTLRYLRGELSDSGAERCARHLHECTECRATLRFGAETMLAARESGEATAQEEAAQHESLRPVPAEARVPFGLRGLFIPRLL